MKWEPYRIQMRLYTQLLKETKQVTTYLPSEVGSTYTY